MSPAFSSLRWRSASERDEVVRERGRGRVVARSLLALTPLLFGVPVALGIVISVIRLLGTRYPDLGFATLDNSDAEQLYLGHTLYQNPAHGYTGTAYTPLFPAMTSLLYHIYLWNGWPLLLVIAASVALTTLAARIAYLPAGPRGRVVRVLGAAGIGGIAYWGVSSLGQSSRLDAALTDQVAWAFALFGLVAVADFGREPSQRRVVLAALLLCAGIWAKQITIGVAVLALAWVFALAATSMLSRKAASLFTAVLGGVNVALLLVLNLLTNGWEYYYNFEFAAREATDSLYTSYAIVGLRSCALAVVFVGLVWLAGAVRAATRWRRSSARSQVRALADSLGSLLAADDPTGRRALLLGLYAIFGFVLAVYFLRKQGTSENEFIGVVWALGLLGAAGWRVAQPHARAAVAAGGCVALYFALAQLGPVREIVEKPRAVFYGFGRQNNYVTIPPLENAVQWPQISSELRSWAKDHTLYLPTYSDLNVPRGGPLYPNVYNFLDKLAAGQQPMFLVRALLDRRFDAVTPFIADKEENEYASGFGKWEENYMWKLNEVIAAGYMAERGLPLPPAASPAPPYAYSAGEPETAALLGRRPGPDHAAWMSDCFGPFAAGGASFRIHRGGGFWCSFQPGRLRLVRAPTPLSEVVTTQSVRLAGTIAVSLEGGASAQVNLVLEDGHATWMARVTVAPGSSRDLEVSTYLGGAWLGSTLVNPVDLPGGRREVRLSVTTTPVAIPAPPVSGGASEATLTAPAAKGPFALVATNGAAFDLNAMRLGSEVNHRIFMTTTSSAGAPKATSQSPERRRSETARGGR